MRLFTAPSVDAEHGLEETACTGRRSVATSPVNGAAPERTQRDSACSGRSASPTNNTGADARLC